ncbi:hypothetical protein RND81_09G137500 [Saponaria officinalis]|uniref:BHLH domain-containing protein n=1 Tax=Saponaria officinalis TaxID=3572 RepID=A0AAW1ILR1_SAPOF
MEAVSMFASHSDLGIMDDLSFIHQVNSIEDLFRQPIIFPSYNNNDNHNNQVLSLKRSSHQIIDRSIFEKPVTKKLKTNDNNNINNDNMLSFGNLSNNKSNNNIVIPKEEVSVSFGNEMLTSQGSLDKESYIIGTLPQFTRKSCRTSPSNLGHLSSSSKEHVLAERKRREKLSQRFIALSAIIPGLKKMDKASVLGDAVKYVKQMQERVKKLEVEVKKKSIESAVLVKKTRVTPNEDDGDNEQCLAEASSVSGGGSCDGPLPEIEVKISDKDVLIRVHCEKKKGVLEKLISQVMKLHLEVLNTSALAFGASSLDVTIITKMKDEFNISAKDLVRHLHDALKCIT